MPMRKRKRTDSLEKLPSLHYRDWLQTTAPINERSAEGKSNDLYKSIHGIKIKLKFNQANDQTF